MAAESVEHAAVIPLQDMIDWMLQRAANFQPTLELIDEMYDVDIGVTYREGERI